jgi:hypothetical protein
MHCVFRFEPVYFKIIRKDIMCVYFWLLCWVPLSCRFTNFGIAVACMWSVILE